MTIKTPEEIAETIALPRVISSGNTLKRLMVEAIEADRRQRDMYILAAEALEDRARGWGECEEPDEDTPAYRAAQALRGTSAEVAIDDAWDRFIGPMLDRMEEEYGR